MEVSVHFIPSTGTYDLYALDRASERFAVVRDEMFVMETFAENGGRARALLSLPPDVWRMIGGALRDADLVPARGAVDEPPAVRQHLADAIAVRDRLLSLIERR